MASTLVSAFARVQLALETPGRSKSSNTVHLVERVNLGSRIQGLTKLWRVSSILDSVTANALPSAILKRRLCRARVVGMDGDVDLYELLSDDSSVHAELVTNTKRLCSCLSPEFRFAKRHARLVNWYSDSRTMVHPW